MRLPRSYSLPDGSIFHLMWRAINGEFLLDSDSRKAMFLDCIFKFLHRTHGKLLLYSFCVMSNHFHEAGELLEESKVLSDWIRSAHCSFALLLNRLLGRHGPVAQDRTKTVVAQDQEQLKRVMFYLDWNPVDAGVCSHPSEFAFSSYRFYAYGEVNKWTRHLQRPAWYEQLGSTDEERQVAYRKECDRYRLGDLLPDEEEAEKGHMIGEEETVSKRNALMRTISGLISKGMLVRRELDRLVALVLNRSVWSMPDRTDTAILEFRTALAAMESRHRSSAIAEAVGSRHT